MTQIFEDLEALKWFHHRNLCRDGSNFEARMFNLMYPDLLKEQDLAKVNEQLKRYGWEIKKL